MCAAFALIHASIAITPFTIVTDLAFPKAFRRKGKTVGAERARPKTFARIRCRHKPLLNPIRRLTAFGWRTQILMTGENVWQWMFWWVASPRNRFSVPLNHRVMAKAVPMETAPSETPAAKAEVIPTFDTLIAIHMQFVL